MKKPVGESSVLAHGLLQAFCKADFLTATANGKTYTAAQIAALENGKAAEFLGAASGKTTLVGLLGQKNANRSLTMQITGCSSTTKVPFTVEYTVIFQQDNTAIQAGKEKFNAAIKNWAQEASAGEDYLDFTPEEPKTGDTGIDMVANFVAGGKDVNFLSAVAGAGLKTLLIGDHSFSDMYMLEVYGDTDTEPFPISLCHADGTKKTQDELQAEGFSLLNSLRVKWNFDSLFEPLSSLIAKHAGGMVRYSCRDANGIEYSHTVRVKFTGKPTGIDTGASIYLGTEISPSGEALVFTEMIPGSPMYMMTVVDPNNIVGDNLYIYVVPNATAGVSVKVVLGDISYVWSQGKCITVPIATMKEQAAKGYALQITVQYGNSDATIYVITLKK